MDDVGLLNGLGLRRGKGKSAPGGAVTQGLGAVRPRLAPVGWRAAGLHGAKGGVASHRGAGPWVVGGVEGLVPP